MATNMNVQDLLQENSLDFHPEILALKEKERVREVILDKPAIGLTHRFWITDQPLLCYLSLDEQDRMKNLIMVNLLDKS